MKVFVIAFLFFVMLSSTYLNLINYSSSSSATTTDTGGYVDEIKFIRYSNENIAYQQVGNGNLDLYLFQIPLQLIEEAKKNLNLKIYEKEGVSFGIVVNPTNSSQTFNPFSLREIRYALNFLIDRNFVVNDILKGFGDPIFEPYGQLSPEYQNIVDVV